MCVQLLNNPLCCPFSVLICRKVQTWRLHKEAGWDAGEPSRKKDEWVVVVHSLKHPETRLLQTVADFAVFFCLFSLLNPSFLVCFLRLLHSESRKHFPKYPNLIWHLRYLLTPSSCSWVSHFLKKVCEQVILWRCFLLTCISYKDQLKMWFEIILGHFYRHLRSLQISDPLLIHISLLYLLIIIK